VIALDRLAGAALVHEALDGAGERHELRVHELEGQGAAEDDVRCPRDRPHPTFPEQLLDPVFAVDDLAGLRVGRG
jgi:hypothetical protein